MNTGQWRSALLAGALMVCGIGIAIAANSNWFTINTSYGTNGVATALSTTSYGLASSVDVNDASHRLYTVVSAAPNAGSGNANWSAQPYSIVRRLSSGAIDTTFGSSGLVTSFQGATDATFQLRGLCIDPVTHNLVITGGVQDAATGNVTTTVERLLPPTGAGSAGLDTSFNASGATPGTLTINLWQVDNCLVLGDQSIVVAGHDNLSPQGAVVAHVLANGTLDVNFGTGGLSTLAMPNGQNWEGGSPIALNSSQTVNPDLIIAGDTYPTGNPSSAVAAVIALDRCTGTPDTKVNGTGFMSVPVIDNITFRGVAAATVLVNGDILAALVGSTPSSSATSVDLIEWPYPASPSGFLSPTYPGTLTPPSGATGNAGARTSPVVQSDGSLYVGAQTASNQETLESAIGTATLGFTVGVPAVLSCGSQVTVPNVVGQPQGAATSAITGAGLQVGAITQQSSSTVAAGNVISQSPLANAKATSGSTVNLVVSSGAGNVTVPNVVDLTQAAATTALTNASLAVGTITQATSATVAIGSVISESPSAGASVAASSSVSLVISSGEAVPNVVGLTQAAAATAITGASLVVGTVTQQSSGTVAAGNVISSTPAAGTSVSPGTQVTLVISTGPQVSVPNVVGQTQAAASTSITSAGLVVGTVTQAASSTVASGNVISESPAAGSMVSGGSSVAITVSTGASSGGGGGTGTSSGKGGGGGFDVWTSLLLSLVAIAVKSRRPIGGRE